ncbi:MAG: hypothetical protein WEC34_16110 [Acidimicrobiia bacterium]
MTTEDVQVRLRSKLERAFGAEEASILMDRPPGGWSDLVTNDVLAARLDALKSELVAEIRTLRADLVAQISGVRSDLGVEIASVRSDLGVEIASVRSDHGVEIAGLRTELHRELRAQTWRLAGLIFVSFGIFATLVRVL